jgi:hypothetical protein
MDLYNAIDRRTSVRKYENRTFNANIINEIKQKIIDVQPLYKDIKARIEFIENPEDANSIGMGFFHGIAKINAPYCIVAISKIKNGYKENIGFMQEQLVLELTDMGIGTCWLGTFHEERLRQLLSLSVEAGITNVISLGYPLEGSFRNNGFRNLVGSKRKKADELAYYNIWGESASKYLAENAAIKTALNYSILAPSGGNKQPVYVLFTDSYISFFVKNKNNDVVVNPWAELDAGIFISHFYLCCKEQKINVSFFSDPDANSVPPDYSYIISLSCKVR